VAPTFLCLWVIAQHRDFGFWRAVSLRAAARCGFGGSSRCIWEFGPAEHLMYRGPATCHLPSLSLHSPYLFLVSMPIPPEIRCVPLARSLLRRGCDCEVGRQVRRVCIFISFFLPFSLKFILGLLQLVFSSLRRGVGWLRIGVSK
jgi:hypothetical protein